MKNTEGYNLLSVEWSDNVSCDLHGSKKTPHLHSWLDHWIQQLYGHSRPPFFFAHQRELSVTQCSKHLNRSNR